MPFVQIGDVHRAALAAADAGILAEHLGHHAVDVTALGDRVAVPAVRRPDVIRGQKILTDADRDGLLPGVEVNEPRDVAGGVFLVQAFLESANLAHLPIGLQELVFVELHNHAWSPFPRTELP
jgi:hypothetical protein